MKKDEPTDPPIRWDEIEDYVLRLALHPDLEKLPTTCGEALQLEPGDPLREAFFDLMVRPLRRKKWREWEESRTVRDVANEAVEIADALARLYALADPSATTEELKAYRDAQAWEMFRDWRRPKGDGA